jgi:hypothetical protein
VSFAEASGALSAKDKEWAPAMAVSSKKVFFIIMVSFSPINRGEK